MTLSDPCFITSLRTYFESWQISSLSNGFFLFEKVASIRYDRNNFFKSSQGLRRDLGASCLMVVKLKMTRPKMLSDH